MKFFSARVVRTEICKACRKLKLFTAVCKSGECRMRRKLAR